MKRQFKGITLGVVCAAGIALSQAASAEEHVVKAVVTQWRPMVLFVKPGDTVRWTNMAGHDVASIDGMIPEGAKPFHSKMGENFSYTFEKEGAYIYQCTPHASLGMIGAVVVGKVPPENLQAIENDPRNKSMIGRAIRKMKQAIAQRSS